MGVNTSPISIDFLSLHYKLTSFDFDCGSATQFKSIGCPSGLCKKEHENVEGVDEGDGEKSLHENSYESPSW